MSAKVLFLAANPRDQTTLGLDKELRSIEEKLRASGHGDVFELRSVWALRPDDLLRLFNEEPPTILHYSGHGSKSNELLLLDEHDQTVPVKSSTLAKLFALLADRTRVVFFNACYSEGQAEAIVEHVECAIGMHTEVGDRAAIAFAAAFYRALAAGRSVRDAFDQGRLAIELEGLKGVRAPRLLTRSGVDPALVFVLAERPAAAGGSAWRGQAPEVPALDGDRDWHAVLCHRSLHRTWALHLYDALREQGNRVVLGGCAPGPDHGPEARPDPARAGLGRSRAAVLVWSQAVAEATGFGALAHELEERAGSADEFRLVALSLDGSHPPLRRKGPVLRAPSASGPSAGPLLRLLFALAGREPPESSERYASELEQASLAAEQDVQAAVLNGRPADVLALAERGGVAWEVSPWLGCEAAGALLRLGALREALGLLADLETRFPGALRPRQLRALALARRGEGGDLEEAQRLLGRLVAAGERDPETLGLYARTWTDRYERSRAREDLLQARDLLAEAFRLAPDDAYVGINAAAKSVFAGELERGRALAGAVGALLAAAHGAGDYWSLATAAEAALIAGDAARAAELYARAVGTARQERGSHESTWRQACRLRGKLGVGEVEWKGLREAFAHLPDWSAF